MSEEQRTSNKRPGETADGAGGERASEDDKGALRKRKFKLPGKISVLGYEAELDDLVRFFGRSLTSREAALLAGMILVSATTAAGVIKYGNALGLSNTNAGTAPARTTAYVHSSVGFQSSGLKVTKGEAYHLKPRGAVHVSGYQSYNRTRAMRCLIYLGSDANSQIEFFGKNHQKTAGKECVLKRDSVDWSNNLKAEFYRHWVGPEGEDRPSDTFEPTKLMPRANWGALLGVVLPAEADPETDPFKVLDENNQKKSQMFEVTSETTYKPEVSGYLHFVVNDGVMSPSPNAHLRSQKLNRAIESFITNNPEFQKKPRELKSDRIPLYLYHDNRGFFTVEITKD